MKWLSLFLLSALSFAQVPAHVTASMDEESAPELQVWLSWQAVPNASSYNVYKAAGTATGTCPNTPTLDATTASNFYLDDPNPGWWQIPVTGAWRSKFWCYSVSSIVNGVESAISNQAFVTIGNAGYLSVYYDTGCTGQIARVVPFPYMGNQIIAHFYYTDSAGVQHEIPSISFYNAYPYPPNDPVHSFNEEWEWKTPAVGLDGTTIPWIAGGKYTYTLITPDGGNYSGWFAPQFQTDASYFNQITIVRANGSNCPVPNGPGGNYDFWQNVTR